MRPVSHRARRDDTNPLCGETALQRDLVVVLVGPDLEGLHLREPEVEEDRLLDPFVDHPGLAPLLGHPDLAPVESGDRPFHGVACLLVGDVAGKGSPDRVFVGQRHSPLGMNWGAG